MTQFKISARLNSIRNKHRANNEIVFVSADFLSEDFRKLQSKRLTLHIAETNGHDIQEALPLPVVEVERPAPQLIVCHWQPMGKPRMTRRDQWLVGEKMREVVARFWKYAEELRKAAKGKIPEDISGMKADFYIAFPKSYSMKERLHLDGKPHEEKPDLDNLAKGVMDSLISNDQIISEIHCRKFWTNGDPRTEVTFF
jgi:Holliday junction resolvase RusA-like endonuclease